MSIAIRWQEDENDATTAGLLYFDVVTAYTQNYRGQVTKHPVDTGGNISDHFVKENPVFTISGVFTGVDISTGTFLIRDQDNNLPFNNDSVFENVSVNSNETNRFKKFLPDSIGQFLSDPTPEITMQEARQDLTEQIRDMIVNLVEGIRYNEKTSQFDSHIQLVSIYEYEGRTIKRIRNNFVLNNIMFREDANSGNALYADITLEQVTFARLEKTQIPADVANSIKGKSAKKVSKGKQDSQVKDIRTAPEDAPKENDAFRIARENG